MPCAVLPVSRGGIMTGRYFLCLAMAVLWLMRAGVSAEESAPKWGEITEQEKALTPPAQYPEAPAAVIFDIAQAEVWIHWGKTELERHVRIKVFKKDASAEAAKVEISYSKGEKIIYLEAQSIAPDGTTTNVKDFYTKKTETARVLTFTFPAVEDGVILEYRYRLDSKYLLDPWYFQGPLYTVKSKISIAMPTGFPLSANRRNILVEPRVTHYEPGSFADSNYTYEAQNLFPSIGEPFIRAKEDCLASVTFVFGNYTWKEIGEGWDSWFEDFSRNKKSIKAVADAQCAGLSTNEEKTRRLFAFVHDSIITNTKSDEVEDAGAILKNRRCDGWYKNELLTALLRSQDIPAHLLRIARRDEHGDFNPAAYNPNQLDYLLCLVGSDSTGFPIDAWDEFAVYPRVPSYCLVNRGLVIDADSTRTITLPQPAWKNGTDVVSTIWTQPSGAAVCTTSIRVYGCSTERYKEFMPDTISSEDIVKRFLSESPTAYTVVSAGKTFDKEAGEFTFDMVLNLPTFGSVIDSNLFVAPFWCPIEQNPFSSDRRFFPVDLSYPYTIRHRIRVYLPENMAVADVPVEVRKQIPGGSFSRKILMEGNVVDARADLKIEKACFAVPEYPDLKALFETMGASGAAKIAAAVKTQGE
jgi:hypothetical protein